jgi:hypothetical protein
LSIAAAEARRQPVQGSLRLAVALTAALVGCAVESPPRGLEATCAKACETRAAQCSAPECRRGCNLVMDRLAEAEGDHVLVCVARTKKACDDRAWARCAALIGPHADGGPPPPPLRKSTLEEEGD